MSRNRAVKSQKSRMTYQENTIRFDQVKPVKQRPIDIVPRTRNQERLVLALQDADQHIVITAGPAGTGKSYLGILAAVKAFREGAVNRIVLTRPAISVEGEEHGFLPGDLNEKLAPWMQPIFDNVDFIFNVNGDKKNDNWKELESQGLLKLEALTYIRGRSIPNEFIILVDCA